jgi:hypothetical protein
MSISHKAYLFDHAEFSRELSEPLFTALASGDIQSLREFIERFRPRLTDPMTGESTAEDWETSYRHQSDVQQYADLALTKYYDPESNLGLDYGFDALGSFLEAVPKVRRVAGPLICGYLFGPKGRRLDPGYMGTGLLSSADVRRQLRTLEQTGWPPIPSPEDPIYAECYYSPTSVSEVRSSLNQLTLLYRRASKCRMGILFTDYNDRGVRHL